MEDLSVNFLSTQPSLIYNTAQRTFKITWRRVFIASSPQNIASLTPTLTLTTLSVLFSLVCSSGIGTGEFRDEEQIFIDCDYGRGR